MTTKTMSNPFEFTATEWDTVEVKHKFYVDLIRFVQGGFKVKKFTKKLYQRLSNCFSHIAHYDQGGFFHTWFSDSTRQRQWVQYIHEHRPYGDPKFTYCDVERQFQEWLRLNFGIVENVIQANKKAENKGQDDEQARRDCMRGHKTQAFKVVARTSNCNSFGLRQYVMLAADGCCYKVCHSDFPMWEVGQVFNVPLRNGLPTWDYMSIEIPERQQNAPADLVAEYWKD